MKALIGVLLMVVPMSLAQAQWSDENMMGLFFSASEFTDATTNLDTAGFPFNAYIVILNPELETIGGYEVGVSFSDPLVIPLSAQGPNGWTTEGDYLNQIVSFDTAVPVVDDSAVLCTLQLLYTGEAMVEICFGPADPTSLPDHEGAVLISGNDGDDLIPCVNPLGEGVGCLVATLNNDSPGPAVEQTAWTTVKTLFR